MIGNALEAWQRSLSVLSFFSYYGRPFTGFLMRAGSRQHLRAISRELTAYFSLETKPVFTNNVIENRY